jgi:hypothetical protein
MSVGLSAPWPIDAACSASVFDRFERSSDFAAARLFDGPSYYLVTPLQKRQMKLC